MDKLSNIDPWNCSLEDLQKEMDRLHDLVDYYEGKQLANKKFINSVYGAMASKYFIASNVRVAEAITTQGQDLNHFSENSVNAYFSGMFQNDVELHKELGISTENAKKVTIEDGAGMITKVPPCTGEDFWYLKKPWTLVVAGDTDSQLFDTQIVTKNGIKTIEELFNEYLPKATKKVITIRGAEVINADGLEVAGYDIEQNKAVMRKANYIMRHKVSKAKFKITAKTGETVTVTGDHSCMVYRNGKVIDIKAKDINPLTDKLIRLKPKVDK